MTNLAITANGPRSAHGDIKPYGDITDAISAEGLVKKAGKVTALDGPSLSGQGRAMPALSTLAATCSSGAGYDQSC